MITANNIRVEIGKIPKNKSKDVIYFSSFEEMQKVLNNNRIELLEAIKKYNPQSIYELASIVDRDQGNVTKDINILEKYGFVEVKKSKEGKRMKSAPSVDSDAIEMIIKLGAGFYGVAKDSIEQISDEFKGENLKKNKNVLKKTINNLQRELKE